MAEIIEKIISDLLKYYLGLDDHLLELHLQEPNIIIKERVATIDDLQVIIYSSDHNPPHFHVKTKNLNIDAKFKIENCELISGEISSKDLKKVKAFYLSPKGKMILDLIWSKRKQN
ncbi:MAG: DUF4160 domain-containing protein [Cyclobacteriaceae bacterium]|nr:DUF4160 domain-containing protein [Cyclobacteriaceae bacterium]